MLNGLVRNTLLIAKREYLERVRSRVFRITTVLVPVGMGGLALLGGLGGRKLAGPENMAIVSTSSTLANDVRATLEEGEAGAPAPQRIEVYAPATTDDMAVLKQQIAAHQIAGYLLIDEVPGAPEPEATWISSSSVDFFRREQMEGALRSALIRQELLARGMSQAQVQELMQQVHLKTMQVKNGSMVASNSERSFAGAYGLILVLYASVLIYGINIARSVVEEKTSRIFEVLLSTASPDSLMLGKLLGVGAVGLTQMGIWGGLLAFYAGSALAASQGIHGLASLGLTRAELVYFPIYFLGGFFLYSGLAAALGSSVSGEQEVQQFSFILISPLVVSVVLLPYVLGNPSSTASVVLSLIPPFTPIIMYMRICSQTPPMWQVALSIALLAGSVWAMVWVAARIYRVGVLMYGKRATLPEMIRWMKYS
ncbi:MAG TPA: ABC transporter permease [Acidobacteriaceae bacterium]|jgi:ABC-2 type transport system permease protein|nr:ABC transporter permease [Acidobacteriaceae bacterium]